MEDACRGTVFSRSRHGLVFVRVREPANGVCSYWSDIHAKPNNLQRPADGKQSEGKVGRAGASECLFLAGCKVGRQAYVFEQRACMAVHLAILLGYAWCLAVGVGSYTEAADDDTRRGCRLFSSGGAQRARGLSLSWWCFKKKTKQGYDFCCRANFVDFLLPLCIFFSRVPASLLPLSKPRGPTESDEKDTTDGQRTVIRELGSNLGQPQRPR